MWFTPCRPSATPHAPIRACVATGWSSAPSPKSRLGTGGRTRHPVRPARLAQAPRPYRLRWRLSRFRAELRHIRYDLVIDARVWSKAPGWRGRRAPLAGRIGLRPRAPAARFYSRGYAVPKHDVAHAVERARRLFAQALDYPLPETRRRRPGPFALPAPDLARPMCCSCTAPPGPASAGRCRSGARWVLDRRPRPARGAAWGSEAERADAEAIAAACGGLVLPRLGLTELAAGWRMRITASVWTPAWPTSPLPSARRS